MQTILNPFNDGLIFGEQYEQNSKSFPKQHEVNSFDIIDFPYIMRKTQALNVHRIVKITFK